MRPSTQAVRVGRIGNEEVEIEIEDASGDRCVIVTLTFDEARKLRDRLLAALIPDDLTVKPEAKCRKCGGTGEVMCGDQFFRACAACSVPR